MGKPYDSNAVRVHDSVQQGTEGASSEMSRRESKNITSFGKFMRRYRINHEMTQKEMADLCDIPQTYLSLMERGLKGVTEKFQRKIVESISFTENQLSEFNQVAFENTRHVLDLNKFGPEGKKFLQGIILCGPELDDSYFKEFNAKFDELLIEDEEL